jgi:hemoglobin
MAVFLGVLAMSAPSVRGQGSAAPRKEESLYKRLGGYDALAAVTDEFIMRLVNDPKLTRFFTGVGNESKNRIRQLVVDQLCAATGGPCVYIGRDMKKVHAGMGITEADWQTMMTHLTGTLDKFKVPAKEKSEVVAAIGGLKGDIVEKK